MIDYDRLAAEYARNRQVHPKVLADLVATGGLTRESRLLEVGCGTGNYLVALAEAFGCDCVGIDPSAEMLGRARSRGAAVDLRLGRAESLDFPDESFDLVFSVDVIHHVADRASYFREARRVLRPGGRVCTVTDSAEIIRSRVPLAAYFPETVAVELGRYPDVSEVERLMAAAGLALTAERVVEHTYELTDARPYRERAFSALHLVPEEAFERGLARLEADLVHGPIPCVARYVLIWGAR